jgi:hypothetical protein
MVEMCIGKMSLLNRKAKPSGVAEVVSPRALICE